MITWRLLRDIEPKLPLLERLAAARGITVDAAIVAAVDLWLDEQLQLEARGDLDSGSNSAAEENPEP